MYDISVERAYAPGSARNPQEAQLPTWLASTNTRDALGVPWQGPNVVWSLINQNILTQWHNNGDWYTNARLNLDIILSDPLSTFRVLLYAVSNNFISSCVQYATKHFLTSIFDSLSNKRVAKGRGSCIFFIK